MKFKTNTILLTALSAGMLAAASSALAQDAAPYSTGDLLVGFTVGSGNDLIVNLGPAGTALVNGNSWNLSSLLSGFNSGSLVGINWGVVGVSNFPNRVYVTFPQVNPPPPAVPNLSAFNGVKTAMSGLGLNLNGSTGSGTPPASAAGDGSWNNGTFVAGGSGTFITAYANPNGNTGGGGPPITLPFFSAVQGGTPATQVGTFTLSAAGVLTFNTNSVVVAPPPPQIVQITRVGNISTVYFTTTNGSFTYSLYYTNSIGLPSPMSTWPTAATTVTGNGLTNSIPDTTTDSNRFYRVGVH